MPKRIVSFAVGASVSQGKFLAVVLKFKLDDNTELFTAWPVPQSLRALKIMHEYTNHLRGLGLYTEADGDKYRPTLEGNAPVLTLDEIEGVQVAHIVEDVNAVFANNGELKLSLSRKDQANADELIMLAVQHEIFTAYIAQVLNQFTEDGELDIPEGLPH